MITKSKLAELRKTWDDNGWYDEDPTTLMPELMDTISTLLDENEKLRRVAEAAKYVVQEYDRGERKGYEAKISDDMYMEINQALAVLEGKE